MPDDYTTIHRRNTHNAWDIFVWTRTVHTHAEHILLHKYYDYYRTFMHMKSILLCCRVSWLCHMRTQRCMFIAHNWPLATDTHINVRDLWPTVWYV